MQVTAVSTPNRPEWRWRIVNYAGEIIEESRETFGTISAALVKGNARMTALNVTDTSTPSRAWRSTSHLRGPAKKTT